MKAFIVSKTRMLNGVCVGGVLYDGTGIRLLDSSGHNQSANCPYGIGDIFDLTYVQRTNLILPHSEDVFISDSKFIKKEANLLQVLTNQIQVEIARGDPDALFDCRIQWTSNGSGFIASKTGIPTKSVVFFRANCDLILDDDEKYYRFKDENSFASVKKLKYVGFQEPVQLIPRDTLIRVSLARWWKPEDVVMEERCYAQLSGWYD